MIYVTCCKVVATLLLLVCGSYITELLVLRFNQSVAMWAGQKPQGPQSG